MKAGGTLMNMALKVTTIGNSAGVILPKELLAKLRVEKGDSIYLTETADGYKLMAYDPKFEQQMQIAEAVMREDRDVLRRLAS
jgi:putative addiction module antidote